jgi:predicted dehydrogenase
LSDHPPLKFAAIGLDHRHIYHQVGRLLDLGAECKGYYTRDSAVPLDGFVRRFPDLPRVRDVRALLEDPEIQLIVTAAIPSERAEAAIEAMRHGKDVMVDKPGVTTKAQLGDIVRLQRQTGRIWSVNFSERFEVPAMTRATELVRAGAIGRVVQTVGFGPHRLNRHLRPDWFFHPAGGGGILTDIGSHQIDQFLHFTGSESAQIIASPTACPPGVMADARSSAPRATSSCESMSILPGARVPTTCSWSTRRPVASSAAMHVCPTTSA